jgi:microsomal epoxide hydrolase
VAYWQRDYDWRRWEAVLNTQRQYTMTIHGISLHFIHEPATHKDAIPLLLLHGWPGSVFEFYKLLPLLQATRRFHIVAPSLPGAPLCVFVCVSVCVCVFVCVCPR